ncbi:HAD hydrolase-like protein [Apibacter raozihei]|uniref:HAD family hydrolase n=1 Tax=Apibacter raozihei TaxID=2500547 RepID=UPI000FE37D76|nr:HAD hydrolase-like protein [Apibacter raozihei]
MRNIKHIFFDLDNTLWDTDRNSMLTLKQMYEDVKVEEIYNVNFQEFYDSYYQRNEHLWALFRQDKVTKNDILSQRFKNTFEEFDIRDEVIRSYFDAHFLEKVVKHNTLIDNTVEVLSYLKSKGYIMHIVSNGFIKPTERKVYDTPIKDYITTITSGEEINKRKPAREVFELGLDKANANPEESSFIGDDFEADVLGSDNLGMLGIYFNYKKDSDLSKMNGFPVINNLIELKQLF